MATGWRLVIVQIAKRRACFARSPYATHRETQIQAIVSRGGPSRLGDRLPQVPRGCQVLRGRRPPDWRGQDRPNDRFRGRGGGGGGQHQGRWGGAREIFGGCGQTQPGNARKNRAIIPSSAL